MSANVKLALNTITNQIKTNKFSWEIFHLNIILNTPWVEEINRDDVLFEIDKTRDLVGLKTFLESI